MDGFGQRGGSEFEKVVLAAKAENWDFVDRNLSIFCDDDGVIRWALEMGARSQDDNERDLAASILEKTGHEIGEEARTILMGMLREDRNPYAMFRAAFALFAHGDRSEEVIGKIKEALGDEDVKDIAKEYLSRLDK